MTNLLRLPLVLLVFILTSAGAIAQQGTWSVNQAAPVTQIATSVNQNCTYQIQVDPNQGDVDVVVRNANGDKVRASSGSVKAGNSRNFDLQQGWSIEVRFVHMDSTGTYQRLP